MKFAVPAMLFLLLGGFAAAAAPAPPGSETADGFVADEGAVGGIEAPASEPDPEQLAWQHYLAGRYALLSRSERPRDRALATLLPLAEAWPPRDLIRMDAAAAAPADVLVQWIWASAGAESGPACRRDGPLPERAAHLLQLEPDNAAALLPRLGRAWNDDDAPAIDATLIEMAAAHRFDIHFLDLIEAGLELFDRHPLPADLQPPAEPDNPALPADLDGPATLQALAAAQAATVMPSYQPLVGACDAQTAAAVSHLRRYAACADVARLMLRAPTLIDRSLGYLILAKSGQATPADGGAAARHAWLTRQVWSVFRDHGAPASAAFLRAFQATRDETAALEQVVQQFGTTAAKPGN